MYLRSIIVAAGKDAPSDTKIDFGASTQESSPEAEPSSRPVEAFEYAIRDTANDVSGMRRLGKKQELGVRQSASCRYSICL